MYIRSGSFEAYQTKQNENEARISCYCSSCIYHSYLCIYPAKQWYDISLFNTLFISFYLNSTLLFRRKQDYTFIRQKKKDHIK